MSDVAPIPTLASLYSTPEPVSTAGTTNLGEDAFLRLLTTQLQYQDPSDPVKNEAFVAQLAQFSSLEQLTNVNGTLDGVYAALAAMNNASMASLLGTRVVAEGDTFDYAGAGPHDLSCYATSAVSSGTLTIHDASGSVVYSGPLGALAQGQGVVAWNGLDTSGNQVPAGEYTFSITGLDGEGNTVEVIEQIVGVIDEMDYSTGTPLPSVNGMAVDIADIVTLQSGGVP